MTEHEMQTILTAQWQYCGPTVNGQKLFLTAWELMVADFRMNRWGGRWSPSVDFCFLDRHGGSWFKPILTGRADSWSALCLVTHRSVLFAQAVTLEKLEGIYVECLTTSPRSNDLRVLPSLLETHASYFGLPQPLDRTVIGLGPVQRVVAAQTLSEEFWIAAGAFDSHDHSQVMEAFGRTGLKMNLQNPRAERTRFAALGDWGASLSPSVFGFTTGPLQPMLISEI
jgi:hypothetical protein